MTFQVDEDKLMPQKEGYMRFLSRYLMPLKRNNLCKKMLVMAIILWLPLSGFAINKRAVVIGLGKYQDKTWSTIHGDRDVPIVKKMLSECGYADIVTLVNQQATKSGIETAFSSLMQRCRKGDIIYIHFSGHGQNVTDLNGDEDDGFDEAWIPYDAQLRYSSTYKGEKHLIDDEIAVWMEKIRNNIGDTGKLLVVVDACHSGDSSRKDDGNEEIFYRGTDEDFIIPLAKASSRIKKKAERWLTLTACKDYQVNCEVKTKSMSFYGMLSYALCSMANDMKTMTNQQALDKLCRFIDKYRGRLPQEPTLTGETSKTKISDFL